MYDYDKYISLIKNTLSEYRFLHCMGVAEKARELAGRYGVDADKAYLAGILHDITKETDYTTQEKYIAEDGVMLTLLENNNKKVYHQMSGAAYVKNYLKIADSDIINGIRYHTTGRVDMTDFEMVIYLADLTSTERSYPDVEEMRSRANSSLLDGMLYALRYVIIDLASHNRAIHPDTLHCFNWVVAQIHEKKE